MEHSFTKMNIFMSYSFLVNNISNKLSLQVRLILCSVFSQIIDKTIFNKKSDKLSVIKVQSHNVDK